MRWWLCSLLFVTFLSGGIVEHLKPCHHKSCQGIKNVDFVYMINLDERPKKIARSLSFLRPYNITPYRFSAVNAWKMSEQAINEVGVLYDNTMKQNMRGSTFIPGKQDPRREIMQPGKQYFWSGIGRGDIGAALSHMSIMKDAIESGYQTIWVMEDDIKVDQDPHIISVLIERLDALVGREGWDILFTNIDMINPRHIHEPRYFHIERPDYFPKDPEIFKQRIHISQDFTWVGCRVGAHSMIMRRSGCVKLFNFLKEHHIFCPIDSEYILPEGIRLYSLRYDVVSNEVGTPQDTGFPNYTRDHR